MKLIPDGFKPTHFSPTKEGVRMCGVERVSPRGLFLEKQLANNIDLFSFTLKEPSKVIFVIDAVKSNNTVDAYKHLIRR
jgi:hypothetical protein